LAIKTKAHTHTDMFNPKIKNLLLVLTLLANNLVLAAEALPRLFKPSTVTITHVNGKKIQSGLSFLSRNQGIELNQGTNTLELYYEQMLQLTADDHEVVKSDPIHIVFNAAANTRYTISHPEIGKLETAKKFADAPVFEIKDQNGLEISFNSETRNTAPAKIFNTNDTSFKKLQTDWQNADEETRKRFIEWIKTQ
jgi:uncharacterized protein YccT (UPF0319 family)